MSLKVFISYSHTDDDWREKLNTHLSQLQRDGILAVWHDRKILAGERWDEQIARKLETSDVVLLLISADFIASDYCYEKELKVALERDRQGQARVVPISIRPCDWGNAPFAGLQALPEDRVPVASHPQGTDAALTAVAKGLRSLAEALQRQRAAVSSVRSPVVGSPLAPPRSWRQRHARGLRRAGRGAVASVVLLAMIAVASFWRSNGEVRLGEAYLRIGYYEDALAHFKEAVRRNPLDFRAERGQQVAEVGASLTEFATQQVRIAQRVEALAARWPEDARVLFLQGVLASESGLPTGKLEAGAPFFEKAITQDPKYSEAYWALGSLALLGLDLDTAEERLQRAVEAGGEFSANVPHYRHDRALVLAARDKVSEALNALQANQAFIESNFEQALLLWQSGERGATEQARDLLLRVQDDLLNQDRLDGNGNRRVWQFIADQDLYRFGRPSTQRCLSRLALAVSYGLLSEEVKLHDILDALPGETDCDKVRVDSREVICYHLRLTRDVVVKAPTLSALQCPTLEVPAHDAPLPAGPKARPPERRRT